MVTNSVKLYINRENLIHNVKYLVEKKNKKLLAVVKANGYGHGLEEIVSILYENGQREFGVARYIEAERILKMKLLGIKILVFESVGDYSLIKDKPEIDISINTLEELNEALDFGISPNRIQIKLDFGFGRNGILLKEIEELKKLIENRKFRGIYSHLFALSYEAGLEYIELFNRTVEFLGKENFEIIHLQNSAATLSYDCKIVTHIRVGVAMYGIQDTGFFEKNLKQVFSLEGKVAGVKDLKDSKYVAYSSKDELCVPNCRYIAKVKIGYADGFLKSNEGSCCLIGNREFPIVLVSMDNTFIAVDVDIKEGDNVTFYHNIEKSTAHNSMTLYELLVILSPRLERMIV